MRITGLLLLLLVLASALAAQTEFDIRAFSDSTKYGWQDWRDRLEYRDGLLERQQLLQMYEIQASPIRSTIIKSMLVPGLGQISCDAGTKGSILLGSELLALGTSYLFYDRSQYYYRKYLDATQVEEIETYYNAAQSPRQYSLIFLGLGLVIWTYNIFDVIETTDEYNAKVWRNIVEEFGRKTVTLGPEGIQVRF